MARHNNEKKFKCNLCEASFNVNTDLYRHRKQVHKMITQSRVYKCVTCGEIFNSLKLYNEHNLTHGSNAGKKECPICHKFYPSLVRSNNG